VGANVPKIPKCASPRWGWVLDFSEVQTWNLDPRRMGLLCYGCHCSS